MAMGLDKRDPRWLPIVWLAYLFFFFLHPVYDHVGTLEWIATFAGVAVFLGLYFGFFRLSCPWNRWCLVGMLLLGLGYSPWNEGAVGFFIYAAAFLPFALDTEWQGPARRALVVGLGVVGGGLFHLSHSFIFTGAFFCTFIGAGNIYFAQRNRNLEKLKLAQDQIEHLAKVA